MAEKVVFMLLNSNPDAPATLAAPFFQATVAAALDLEVEMYFASRAAALLRRGVAEQMFPSGKRERSIYAFMQDAHQAGVKFYICGAAMADNGIDEASAIPEMDGVRGGAAFISTAVEEGVVVLTY